VVDPMDKVSWQGRLISVQPRIRLTRSFDERSHSYLGYALRVEGELSGTAKIFSVGIGKAAQAKLMLQAGDAVSGLALPVPDPRLEPVDLYRTSRLRVLDRATEPAPEPPPWRGVALPLPVYRERGHRRLDARTYEAKCSSCIWGCRMPVELIIDKWNPSRRRHRSETFCYGPKSCAFYRAGATRKAQDRKAYMVHEEEDWVDEDATRHRRPDA
jgi:hypothetical protein